ncbi:hypothetical protein RJT34_01880 [Clitoria ternatea]|uniref:Uncharacterized protein n=1 Tax=Clitoria ternatea TaxID=43366 RepID=A0AAN9KHI1_CLITE
MLLVATMYAVWCSKVVLEKKKRWFQLQNGSWILLNKYYNTLLIFLFSFSRRGKKGMIVICALISFS